MASAAPSNIQINSCMLGGHLLGRGSAVQSVLQEQFPNAEIKHSYACPLQFSIVTDGKEVLGGLAGTCTILQLLMCCTSAQTVARWAGEDACNSDRALGA
mmetsp:Transcript_26447/g.51821  ORF Transcript_26447/g.51821 Transcript_26447/m.51821 type:complete len:100 (-) Transcript_26447:445-744(-)